MNTLLLVITLASLAGTAAMAVLVVKLLRDERQRSDARASLLQELAGEQAVVAGGMRASAHVAALNEQPPAEPPGPAAPTGDMFAVPAAESPWTSRLGIIGAMALLLCGALAIAVFTGRPYRDAPPSAPTAEARPLELVSLAHTLEPGRLRISGTVENPSGATPLTQVTATALLFDAGGGFITSGRAPLDYTTLSAGEESPFVIAVPVARPVARYRISFRTAEGRIIDHIDRRNGAAVARNEP